MTHLNRLCFGVQSGTYRIDIRNTKAGQYGMYLTVGVGNSFDAYRPCGQLTRFTIVPGAASGVRVERLQLCASLMTVDRPTPSS